MKKRINILAVLLTVAMIFSLAACSGSADPKPDSSTPVETPDTSETQNPSVLPEGFNPDPNVEDLSLAIADIPGDFELLTVNGIPVSTRMYLYWLAYSISETEATMYNYYGASLDWSEEAGLAKYMMADALNATLMYTLVPAKAKELGLDLTDEQRAELDAHTAEIIATVGGEEKFNTSLRRLGLTLDTYLAINGAPYYYQNLLHGMFSDRPTDADVEEYISKNDILSAKHILLLTMDMTTRQPLADDVIAQKKATAEDILKQLQSSDNLAADFDALMHKYSEDSGLTTNPDGYIFTAGEMVSEFENGTRALEFGQISGIVESSYGYHIILRQNPDSPSLRNDCLTALASAQIETWVSEADVVLTDEYNNLNPQLFYEKFMSYQAVFSALAKSES